MADTIGGITVPSISSSGTFPLVTEYPHSRRIEPQVAIHQFISGSKKIEQRFLLGDGARRWRAGWKALYETDLTALRDFWEARKGAYQPFTYNAPSDDGLTTEAVTVRFEDEPLSWERFSMMVSTAGVGFVEIPATAPTYTLTATVERFPAGALETALLSQVQQMIPLVKIQPKTAGYPAIYLSDRRCTIGAQLYQARLLSWGNISQRIGGQSDNANFTFGNADKVMRDLAADVDLFRADIEFSLFHVTDGALAGHKIDLWKGEVIEYESTSGVEFQMRAVDGLYDLTSQYPVDRLSPQCWKQQAGLYNDGEACPFAITGGGHTANTLDLVNFPSADAADCDGGLLTPNGCKAHTMKRYYGGIEVTPQSIRTADNSRGWFGFGRPSATSTSQISDSLMGQPLIEVYTDSPMPVKALLAAGRDEGDFYEALGILGAGPIGSWGRGTYDNAGNRRIHTLDGQPHHGDPGGLGLREIAGTDPAGASDWLSLDQGGDQTNGDPDKVYNGSSTFLDHFSAGVAFVVIRRTDEKGFQLTNLTDHNMEVIVGSGLTGWVWTAPGTRSQQILSNPIWIAVNVYLKGIGMRFATAAEAEARFDVASAIACAAICDLTVDKLIGAGTETQFVFNGVIRDRKVLKDWIQEILNNCLGGFIFSFGKIKFFIREDAAAAHSFSGGNMIYGSLRLRPIKPAFNRLEINFANRDYEFVADMLPVIDRESVEYLGGRTLDSTLNLAGAAGKSMAGRIGVTRLKEEQGGVGATEKKQAREATWKTTVLALGVEPGMGISIDDDEVPGGTGLFRVDGWSLNPDYSIDLSGLTITDTMYDQVAGPKLADVPANGVPAVFFPEPLKSAWCANQDAPPAGDALFDEEDKTFGLAIEYEALKDGSKLAMAAVYGELPVNVPKPDTLPPIVRSQAQATSGGSLKGDRNYWARVYARDVDGLFSPGSNIRHFTFEGTMTDVNQITLGDIEWPAGDWASMVLAVGDDEKTICVQDEETGTGELPGSIVFSGPLKESSYNAPSPMHTRVRARAKRAVHFGIIGEQISAVDTAGGVITVAALIGFDHDLVGRFLYVASDVNLKSARPAHFEIVTFDPYTGELTLTPDPLDSGMDVGDLVTIRMIPTTYTGLTIGDAFLLSTIYPTGLVVDGEVGMVIRGVTPGRPHQLRRIVSNTATVYTVDRPFDFEPAYFVVELAAWQYIAESTPVPVPAAGVIARIPIVVDNLIMQPITVGGFLVDRRGNETPEEFADIREGFVFGMVGTSGGGLDGYVLITLELISTTYFATPDLSLGLNQEVFLDQPEVDVNGPTSGLISQTWTLVLVQDSVGGRAVVFDPTTYVAGDSISEMLDRTPNTYCSLDFIIRLDGKSALAAITTGIPVA